MLCVGERTLEKVDSHDAGPDISAEETVTTTTAGVNGGEDIVHSDKPNTSDASTSEEDDESVDSSFHTHCALHHNASTQKAEAHARPFSPHHHLSDQTQAASKITPSLHHQGLHIFIK